MHVNRFATPNILADPLTALDHAERSAGGAAVPGQVGPGMTALDVLIACRELGFELVNRGGDILFEALQPMPVSDDPRVPTTVPMPRELGLAITRHRETILRLVRKQV